MRAIVCSPSGSAAARRISVSGPWAIALMTAIAIGSSVAFPNSGALMSRSIDPDHQGQIMGLNNACGAFARFAGPSGAAFVYSAISIDGPYFMGAVVVAPAILLALAAGKAAGRV